MGVSTMEPLEDNEPTTATAVERSLVGGGVAWWSDVGRRLIKWAYNFLSGGL
jgi:hypothetical protein